MLRLALRIFCLFGVHTNDEYGRCAICGKVNPVKVKEEL